MKVKENTDVSPMKVKAKENNGCVMSPIQTRIEWEGNPL